MNRRAPGDDRPRGCAASRLSRVVGKGLLGFQAYIRVVGTQRGGEIQAAGPARLMAAIEGAPLSIGLGIAAVCLFLVGRWLENRFADSH
jgi:hypothetical protein